MHIDLTQDALALGRRNALVESHMWLVRPIVKRALLATGDLVPYEDLHGYGCLGLIDAASRYDPTHPALASFPTFACQRIRGAIFDGVRQEAWFARSAVRDAQTLGSVIEPHLIDPHDHEKARRFEQALGGGCTPDPEASTVSQLQAEWVVTLLTVLNERARRVMVLHYWDELTLMQIGRLEGVCESRISQMITESLDLMRRHAFRKWRTNPKTGEFEQALGELWP